MPVAVIARLVTLGLTSLLFLITLIFTLKTIQTVWESLNGDSNRISITADRKPSGVSANIAPKIRHQISSISRSNIPSLKSKSNDDKPLWTMRITVMSSLCFLMASVFSLINQCITIHYIGWTHNTPDHRLDENVIKKGSPYRYSSAMSALFGYSTLSMVSVERYRMIVQDSQYAPKWYTVRIVRCIIGVNLLILFASVPVDIFVSEKASALVAISPILWYPVILCTVAYSLLSFSTQKAECLPRCNYLSPMIDGSVRLSLITIIAVLSTLIVSVAFLIVAFKENVVTYAILDVLWVFDSTVNTGCLLFTFRRNIMLYQFSLGWLHNLVLQAVVPSSRSNPI